MLAATEPQVKLGIVTAGGHSLVKTRMLGLIWLPVPQEAHRSE